MNERLSVYDIKNGGAADADLVAAQGHSGAQVALGICYANGCGGTADPEDAASW